MAKNIKKKRRQLEKEGNIMMFDDDTANNDHDDDTANNDHDDDNDDCDISIYPSMKLSIDLYMCR